MKGDRASRSTGLLAEAQFREAFDHVPKLSDEDLGAALKAANVDVRLVGAKRREFLGRLDSLLQQYVHGHLLIVGLKRPSPFAVAKRLKWIKEQSRNLGGVLWGPNDPLAIAAWIVLCRTAGHSASKIHDVFRIDVTKPDPTQQAGRMFERGTTKEAKRSTIIDLPPDQEPLLHIRDAIFLLSDIAARATDEHEQRVATQSKDRARHEGDFEMDRLFDGLASLWQWLLGLRPTAGGDPGTATITVTAPFPLFAKALLEAYAKRVPERLSEVLPRLRRSLKLSPAAARSRVRGAIQRATVKD